MTIRYDVSEVVAVQKMLKRTSPEILQEACNNAALLTKSEAVKLIQRGPKTGKTYQRRTVKHQASAPGEAPASDTGMLASSIKADTQPPAATRHPRALAGSTIEYADHLEFGTSKIKPRPFMFPAYLTVKPKIGKLVKAAAAKYMRSQ